MRTVRPLIGGTTGLDRFSEFQVEGTSSLVADFALPYIGGSSFRLYAVRFLLQVTGLTTVAQPFVSVRAASANVLTQSFISVGPEISNPAVNDAILGTASLGQHPAVTPIAFAATWLVCLDVPNLWFDTEMSITCGFQSDGTGTLGNVFAILERRNS